MLQEGKGKSHATATILLHSELRSPDSFLPREEDGVEKSAVYLDTLRNNWRDPGRDAGEVSRSTFHTT